MVVSFENLGERIVNKRWWTTWWGIPVASILCLGAIFHPLETLRDYLRYSRINRSEFRESRWSVFVRSCTSIDMS